MKEFKGTKGPWFALDNSVYWDVTNADGRAIGNTCSSQYVFGDGDRMGKETIANTNLIAAAPELLEALRSIIHGYEGREGFGMFDLVCHGDEIERANAAIAKALGE